jgi:hypothetical protein
LEYSFWILYIVYKKNNNTMKYIKLFENFESSIFDSAAIESLNKKLYDEISEGSAYVDYIMDDWIKQIYDIIKSVAPFKDEEVKITDEGRSGKKISVDINLANPFEITLSECGSISSSSGDETEGISIRFVGEYNFEIEDLETGETKDSNDGTEAEYIFTKNQDSSENYYLSIDTWNDDALPRLFKNIEKALY